MSVKKFLFGLVCSFVMSACFSPMVSSAATTSESVPETEISVNLIDGENATLRPTEIAIVAYADGSTYPVCDHNDPTSGRYPHSTMRYIRTVRAYNYIEMRCDIRDWYECVLCGYSTFWVHGYE